MDQPAETKMTRNRKDTSSDIIAENLEKLEDLEFEEDDEHLATNNISTEKFKEDDEHFAKDCYEFEKLH